MARGGYREGSGRSKQGHYKGIYCGSTYELCWAIHALDHGIDFTRFPGELKKDDLIYIPDFLLADKKTIIEPKGYYKEDSVARKTALAESMGYVVNIMKKEDLKYAFDYVAKTYKTRKFYTLYDGHKPKHKYICSFCNIEFARDNKLKNKCKEAFCGRICAGKGRFKENISTLHDPNHPKYDIRTKGYFPKKLTKEEAVYIFNEQNKSLSTLAKEFNLTKSAIGFIKQKKSYKWIHEKDFEVFVNKEYSSGQEYKILERNKKEEIIKTILFTFKENNLFFCTPTALAKAIIHELNENHFQSLSLSTMVNKIHYRSLLNLYLEEQKIN